MQVRHKNRSQYFDESSLTCTKYYMPFIGGFINFAEGVSVLEAGCGEGGNLYPFAKAGCKVAGIDSHGPRIDEAREFFAEKGVEGEFIHSDIFSCKPEEHGLFDLIILHDVIEHIGDKESLMRHLKRFLKPEGLVFIAFPPWCMPFGGHQQVLSNRVLARLPYIHLLPKRLYRFLMKRTGETDGTIDYMLDLCNTGSSIEKFRKLAVATDYEVVEKRFYFINPHYEAKFGYKPRKLAAIANIPYVRNFFTTSCFWLIKTL